MKMRQESAALPVRGFWLAGCFLLSCVLLVALKTNQEPFSIRTGRRILPLALKKEEHERQSSNLPAEKNTSVIASFQEKEENNLLPKDTKVQNVPFVYKEIQSQINTTITVTDDDDGEGLVASARKGYSKDPAAVDAVSEPSFCDFSQFRSDTCLLHGDVRIISNSSTIVASSTGTPLTMKIRPHARKWDPNNTEIREFSIKTSPNREELPRCTVTHTAPAVLFSISGYVGNFFHEFENLLIPLFSTSRQFQGEVHLLITSFNHGWISKYQPILSKLSRYQIINLDQDKEVHCFPQVHVGLINTKELSMEPSKTPNGYSVSDFRDFLRSVYSLKRKSVSIANGRKPRLLIILRKRSRSFINRKEVIAMGRRLGFKVVAEEAGNLTRFAKLVNSCDVMMGVHGAGLTNMLFLPTGGALIQIAPWGQMHEVCWHEFGIPAIDCGLKYFEYEVSESESSLADKYSRDDPVFTDPVSIHKKGFFAVWSVFLNGQNVRLDVRRFSGVLRKALEAIHSGEN